jgi:hypothetical protein
MPKSRKKKEKESGVTDDSMESEGHGRRQVEKFFIEPEYHGVSTHPHLSEPLLIIRKRNVPETLG